ncbi:hypothetical protein AYI70_g5205 [Smittium culicis]|uniref:Uncharacterized protein n=1 Tax=Smittium culicis TaxID=133412 RepID=A0A1R1XVR2_9FUNG|nr:hypothetical protein AYI70_g5205 [Smittium culicis]
MVTKFKRFEGILNVPIGELYVIDKSENKRFENVFFSGFSHICNMSLVIDLGVMLPEPTMPSYPAILT